MLYLLPHPEHLGENFWKESLPALSAERQTKVLSFRFARDRNLSAAAYLLLRLALYKEYGTACLPECFSGSYGKPYLRHHPAFFSLSHCRQAVVCALDVQEIGVDVEHWDAFSQNTLDTGLLDRVFSKDEQYAIQVAYNPRKVACRLWTAKESVCKYTGEGIGNDMPSILQKTGIKIEDYTANVLGISISICRKDTPDPLPLPCHEVSPASLNAFLRIQLDSMPSLPLREASSENQALPLDKRICPFTG